MTGLAVFLIVLCLILAGLLAATLVGAYNQTERLRDQIQYEQDEHAACHDKTLALLTAASKRSDAALLDSTADAWESIEEQGTLKRLARERYHPGGPSMPALWLRDRAAKARKEAESNEH